MYFDAMIDYKMVIDSLQLRVRKGLIRVGGKMM